MNWNCCNQLYCCIQRSKILEFHVRVSSGWSRLKTLEIDRKTHCHSLTIWESHVQCTCLIPHRRRVRSLGEHCRSTCSPSRGASWTCVMLATSASIMKRERARPPSEQNREQNCHLNVSVGRESDCPAKQHGEHQGNRSARYPKQARCEAKCLPPRWAKLREKVLARASTLARNVERDRACP